MGSRAPATDNLRWFLIPVAALFLVLAMFLLMYWLVAPPQGKHVEPQRVLEGIEVVQPKPEQEADPLQSLDLAPPPPPDAPPSMARNDLPTFNMPAASVTPFDLGAISMPLSVGSGGLNLGSSGSFGGFAGGGRGSGSGGGGVGTGKGFVGKPLIPLSTARPQMPEWACKQGIRGWVEVIFTVLPTGKVANVRLIDADPRGVFEEAAIESVSHWLYASFDKAREVKQKVDMDPADCAYNWK